MQKSILSENSQLITKWQNGPENQTHIRGVFKNREGKLVISHPVSLAEIPLEEDKLKHVVDDLWSYDRTFII